jgi:hypothetical protein
LLAHGRWFSPGIAASSTTKTGRHDIAEILLKVVLKHQKSINQLILLPSLFIRPSTFHILIFSSETTGPIATKLWWNSPWMAPFQICVR